MTALPLVKWCGRDRIKDLYRQCQRFTDRTGVNSRVPSYPRQAPIIGRDVHNGPPTAPTVSLRPHRFRPVPRGLASGRGKVEGNAR
jgi:hypothetical protein